MGCGAVGLDQYLRAAIFYVIDRERRDRHAADAQFRSIITNAPNAIAVHNGSTATNSSIPHTAAWSAALIPESWWAGPRGHGVIGSGTYGPYSRRWGASPPQRTANARSSSKNSRVGDQQRLRLTVEIQMFPSATSWGEGASRGGVATIGTDVTERKKVQRQLQARLGLRRVHLLERSTMGAGSAWCSLSRSSTLPPGR